ncbi:MAG TPA: hypothetical protein VHC63_18040 [Acidimicrobiales bacterium]|nr:hypothetical protein [Acidimicrobiales bacterium]
MRRSLWVWLGALAICSGITATGVRAQVLDPTTTAPPPAPTTTTPPSTTAPPEVTTTTTARSSTTTTGRGATTATTTKKSTAPVPPPASGPSQTLVPDLIGSPVEITTTTGVPPSTTAPTTVLGTTHTETATPIAAHHDSPSGATLILATVAWLASLGGLLLYAEERRAQRWKHLAR